MKTPTKIKIIGLGGIGGVLANSISRFIGNHPDYDANSTGSTVCDIVLIDGDRFETGNIDRQDFENISNKAQEKVRMLSKKHPRVLFECVPEYITEDNVIMNIRENDVVLMCVDNHSTRRLVAERCEELDNIVLISGGNDEIDGNVQIHIKEGGFDITPSILKYHPEIAEAEGDNPGEEDLEREGCEQQMNTTPQIIQANEMAANLMSLTFRNWANGNVDYSEIYFDIDNVSMLKYSLEMRPV